LRAEHQAILVGKNTVITDNPSLTVRYSNGKNPIRIILGNEDEIPKSYNIFHQEATSLFIPSTKGQPLSIDAILHQLYQKNIISVLVEGGANVLQQFIDTNTWNEAHVITSNKNLVQHSTSNTAQYIKAPIITSSLHQTISLENDSIQILKNQHDISNS
jgi:diaminohydroxyphosphoribosylaminopyrimidine deaminase/5-amino-6-(5-phosphoribosylamino)uracil reductase